MKKVLVILFFISTLICRSQIPHLYDHTFPQITSQNYQILEMLEQVDENLIQNDVYHLSSYINRRADAIHIYNVKDWLVSQYENLDIDSINLHDFVVQSSWDTVPKPFTTAPNVLAFKRGTKYPNEYVVCGAHYDSYVITEGDFNPDTLVSPGADDNASGVAGILSAARILSNYSFERSIVFANWNAEEFGLCGSYQYAKQCRNDSLDIVAYFNLDMTGYLNPGDDIHIHLLYTQCDSLLGNFVKQICHTYFPNVNICQAWLPNGDTDYSSFNRNGYQAISPSEDVNHLSPYIHSTEDIIGMSVNSFEQAALFTKLNLACVAHAAGLIYQSVDEIDDYNQEVERYEVFDILGRHVYTKKSVSKNMEEIRVTDLQSGIYIIRFLLKNGNVVTRKIIKN